MLFWGAQEHRALAIILGFVEICFFTMCGAFTFTGIKLGTGQFKDRDYFLTSDKAHERACSMQLKARTVVRGIWAFSSYEAGLQKYFIDMLKATRLRNIRTIRIIDLANLRIEDVAQHIESSRVYLSGSYEIWLCTNIDYEMLLIDNSEAVMFFHMDDPERRSWIEHADPIHVAVVRNMYSVLIKKSKRLIEVCPDVFHMNAIQIRACLQQARDDLLEQSD
jgi:hypothetical protein